VCLPCHTACLLFLLVLLVLLPPLFLPSRLLLFPVLQPLLPRGWLLLLLQALVLLLLLLHAFMQPGRFLLLLVQALVLMLAPPVVLLPPLHLPGKLLQLLPPKQLLLLPLFLVP
jgi:hypothetical protein